MFVGEVRGEELRSFSFKGVKAQQATLSYHISMQLWKKTLPSANVYCVLLIEELLIKVIFLNVVI